MKIRQTVAVLSAITLISFGAGFLLNGFGSEPFHITVPTKDVDERGEHGLEGITRIEVESGAADLSISFGDTQSASAHLTGSIRTKSESFKALRISKDGDVLRIEHDLIGEGHGFIFMSNGSTKMEVIIPEAYAGSLSLATVSGDITADSTRGTAVRELEIGTVSGRARLEGIASPFKADSVSGDVRASFAKLNGPVTMDTVSGDMSLTLPSDAQFSYVFSTVSGSFENEYSVPGARAERGRFEGGTDTSTMIRAHSTSGDVNIVKR